MSLPLITAKQFVLSVYRVAEHMYTHVEVRDKKLMTKNSALPASDESLTTPSTISINRILIEIDSKMRLLAGMEQLRE